MRKWSEWRMGGGEAIFDQDIFIVNYTFFFKLPSAFSCIASSMVSLHMDSSMR